MTLPPKPGGKFVRVRSVTSSKANALAAYDELRRSGRVDRAMVIAALKDGTLQVLGQGMSMDEMAQAMMEAAGGLSEVAERTTPEQRAGAPGREPPPPPPPPGPAAEPYPGEEGGVVNTAWRSFAERVLPADAIPIQRQEMRKAFYGGAAMLLHSIVAFLDPGTEPTDRDLEKMDKLQRELDAFGKAVREGKA